MDGPEQIDPLPLTELLQPITGSIELRILNLFKFQDLVKELAQEEDIRISNNVIYDRHKRVMYLRYQPHALGKMLDVVHKFCKDDNIQDIFILRNNKTIQVIQMLAEIKDKLSDLGLRIAIIKDVEAVEDEERKKLILNDFHILPTGGHCGMNRMYNNIKKYYFWIGLKADTENFVKKCKLCQSCKHSKVNYQPLSITTTATAAFQKVFLDIVGPLPLDDEGNRYILTLQCDLSKFIEGYCIPNKEAATVAKAFVNNFILRFGVPSEVLTDQGTEFIANTFQETCKLLGITQLNSTAYHHETIGALENNHRHLNSYLRIQAGEHPTNWSSWIQFWCFTYNTTVHSETKYTPHELVFGKICKLPSNLTSHLEPLYNADDYPKELKYRLQIASNNARNNLIASKHKRKKCYDQNRHTDVNIYKVGDKIWVKDDTATKFGKIFLGPYEVTEDVSPNVKVKIGDKVVTVHKNRTKLYIE